MLEIYQIKLNILPNLTVMEKILTNLIVRDKSNQIIHHIYSCYVKHVDKSNYYSKSSQIVVMIFSIYFVRNVTTVLPINSGKIFACNPYQILKKNL